MAMKNLAFLFSDRKYLEITFPMRTRYPLNLENPQTFNEKLQWLKLYDRHPEYTKMVDKYEAKEYVANIIGKEHIIPTLGIYDNIEEIDMSQLPNQFVLKCTNDSGGVVICRDKANFDMVKCKKKLNKGLKRNYYYQNREWPYKEVVPRVIAEQYITNDNNDLVDYKVHCFEGEPRFILVCQNRYSKAGLTEDFYTVNWELMDVSRPNLKHSSQPIKRPKELEEMLLLAHKLSAGFHFLRTDFYIVDGKVYFGELTFFPASGMKPFEPQQMDYLFGSWINLPTDNK